MPLTDAKVRALKPREKTYRLGDAGGLYVEVATNGSRYWRMKYRVAGKEKRLAFGVYPDVSLADAREKRDVAKKILAAGGDPGETKKSEKLAQKLNAENTFEAVAREWHQTKADRWSLRYRDEIIDTFEKDIFPYIGKRPIADIKPMELLEALRKMEKRGALEKMRKVRQRCGEVFRFAIITGRANYNPAPDLASALATPKKVHFPFLTANELPYFLNDLAGYTGSIITKTATQIIMLTGVRTQELRFARWEDIDFEKKLWEIPAEVMKMKRPHIVPLSEQVIALFKQLEPISKHHPLVFIGRNDPRKPISKESINQVIELLGYKGRLTGHGFRHTMSTILHEQGFNSAWIETQLAHVDKNAIRGTYNHAQYLDGRREMMQWYADYIGELGKGGGVVEGTFRKTA
ncbi:tyrosine-type recombinase/integrase [Salmonella enterica]|uniref:Tyrosine-type recombinase/integrase n=1 Tax=Salmonella enterica TaxID=28901 RepID=A0A743HNM6_SALER|nr:tyrosine-type recombinase/integrase [Salmonella enterica]EJN2873354.1 tyrosine-type recombinase/integrase [Salmonella enterica subsp. enterica serovar Techimani]EJN2874721.1 tyrosine-type recombinase/integrase [Salmonella enterica subsp. enterica serovar Techimani]EJN3657708.1 tyrosine-type recombinase/integrase [Salmonella enterica subsp. enterica serovar Techimani]EJN3658553.1 tyrosine-type recombinase/integrase [Salmonella enterica subsp. enterica serovar Techimani]